MYIENSSTLLLSDALKTIRERFNNVSTYFGIKSVMSPMDFWIYQEVIYGTKPEVIVEVGNKAGGTLLALTHLLRNVTETPLVVGVDLNHKQLDPMIRMQPDIVLIEGDAVDVSDEVQEVVGGRTALVIEDSIHRYEETLQIIRSYSGLVQVGHYLIVEDSICHHGINHGPTPGPYEAIDSFLSENDDFVSDRSKEDFLITWNPKGYLKRVR